jgi:hypothetical protein
MGTKIILFIQKNEICKFLGGIFFGGCEMSDFSSLSDCAKFSLALRHPLVGWWVGIAEKWRSSFLGVGLAVRCERSEHGASQLF